MQSPVSRAFAPPNTVTLTGIPIATIRVEQDKTRTGKIFQ